MNILLNMPNYSPDEFQKLQSHIDEVLTWIDPTKITDAYRKAIQKGDRDAAVAALASYYRAHAPYNIPDIGAGPYDKVKADNGVAGKMREVNIDHTFEGGKIDFLFNPTIHTPPVNNEWLWQLNRHDWWASMARAYADTKDETYAEAFNAQLLDWVIQTDCPADNGNARGPWHTPWNAPGSAWRTIECGIRLMDNWHTAFWLLRDSDELWDETMIVMLGSMHRQARHLATHPTGSNWLLMESSGIYRFGSLYAEFTDAAELRALAYTRMLTELERQILPDGMQYELSPDYHAVSFRCGENMYKTALATGKGEEFPEAFRTCLYRMAMSAVQLSTPGFTQPRTNDCYTILTRRFTDFAEQIFPEEPAFAYVNSNRKKGAPPAGDTPSGYQPWSGFAVMRESWGPDASYLCFDVGPLGRGHWHQDKLNINLFKGNEELIFDDGGGQYESSRERAYGTSAYGHNTVTVDGLAQNRAEPKMVDAPIDAGWVSNTVFDYARGTYEDGFGDGQYPATHTREVRFCKPDFYIVRDTLTSRDGASHVYGLRFHLDTVTTHALPGGAIHADYGKTWDLLIVPIAEDGGATTGFRAVSGQTEPELLGWYIGRNEAHNHPATTVIMDSPTSTEHCFTTLLIPFRHGEALPTVKWEADGYISVCLGGVTQWVDTKTWGE